MFERGPGPVRIRVASAAVAALLACAPALAEEAGAPDRAPEAEAAPPVAYDALFRLPSDTAPGPPRTGDSDERRQWEARFATARGDLARAETKLAEAQAQLESLARNVDNWRMAAPGARHDPETSPISYKLRNDIRDHREEIVAAERRLRELEVEASLAGVPAEWRRPAHQDAAPGANVRR